MIKLTKPKTCGLCGARHEYAPKGAKSNATGVWFNCACGSTLLSPAPLDAVLHVRLSEADKAFLGDDPSEAVRLLIRQARAQGG